MEGGSIIVGKVPMSFNVIDRTLDLEILNRQSEIETYYDTKTRKTRFYMHFDNHSLCCEKPLDTLLLILRV